MFTSRRPGTAIEVRAAAAALAALAAACERPRRADPPATDPVYADAATSAGLLDSGFGAHPSVDASEPTRELRPLLDASPAPLPLPDAGAANPAQFNGDIDRVAMGQAVGGFPVPIWLYHGGMAIADDAPLPIKEVAALHYRENPDLWFEWRRAADGIEIKQQREWHLLEYPYEFGPLPGGTPLRGTFIGENNPSLKLVKYRFAASGDFDYCEYVGLVMRGSRWSGTYEVSGFLVDLESGDALDTYSFVYDPVMRPNTLWIDGTPFKRDNDDSGTFTCP